MLARRMKLQDLTTEVVCSTRRPGAHGKPLHRRCRGKGLGSHETPFNIKVTRISFARSLLGEPSISWFPTRRLEASPVVISLVDSLVFSALKNCINFFVYLVREVYHTPMLLQDICALLISLLLGPLPTAKHLKEDYLN